jgi:hypothetical protein
VNGPEETKQFERRLLPRDRGQLAVQTTHPAVAFDQIAHGGAEPLAAGIRSDGRRCRRLLAVRSESQQVCSLY